MIETFLKLFLALGLIFNLFFSEQIFAEPVSDKKIQPTLVEAAPVNKGSLISYQTFIGTLYYSETSVVASQVAGLALEVNFDTAGQVTGGQILVKLDHEILDSKIRAIEAAIKEILLQLEKINKDLIRYTSLLKQKNVSQQQYDEVYYNQTALEQKHIALQAQLNVLKIERRQSIIRAPYSGSISKKHINRGEWVNQGGAIATLINPENIYVLFDIPAGFKNQLDKKKNIDVHINQKIYTGIIEGLIIQGDAKTRTLPLKIRLNKTEQSLFGGLEAEIHLVRNDYTNSLIVPRDAVINRFGQDVVFSISEGKARMIPVEIQLYQGVQVAVKSEELKAQMRVITKGNERIFPDQAIVEKTAEATN